MKHILFSLFVITAAFGFTSCSKDSPEVQAQKEQIEGNWAYDNVTVRRSGENWYDKQYTKGTKKHIFAYKYAI